MAILTKHDSYPLDAVNNGCTFCGNPKTKGQQFIIVTDIRFPRFGKVCICDVCAISIGTIAGLHKYEQISPAAEMQALEAQAERTFAALLEVQAIITPFTSPEVDLDAS